MSLLKIENVKISGWEAAIRGMRNPMNSWDKSDSHYDPDGNFVIGENDLDLMKRLYNGGTEHAKYLRMIRVSFDITMPLYFAKQFDTYKIGVNCNSCSTMHKIMARPFHFSDFAFDKITLRGFEYFTGLFHHLNNLRRWYMEYDELVEDGWEMQIGIDRSETYLFKDIYPSKKAIWDELIQLLPSSYMQKRTYEMSLQSLINILKQRKGHKLEEWHDFCDIMLRECPYLKEIMGVEE